MNEFIKQFEELFDDSVAQVLSLDTVFRDVEGWDSLIFLSLMAMVEEEYSVRLKAEELRCCNTIEDIWKIIDSKRNQ